VENFPAVQSWQAEAPDEENVPATQFVHTVEESAPMATENFPPAQLTQNVSESAPTAYEYLPFTQSLQTEAAAPEYLPAMQSTQEASEG